MGGLLIFETKKFYMRKKNIISIIIFCILVAAYIFVNNSAEERKELSKSQNYQFELDSIQNSIKKMELEYKEKKLDSLAKLINKQKNRRDLLQEIIRAESEKDWKSELLIQIKLDTELIQEIETGRTVSGRNIDELRSTISKNKKLFDNNIKPIIEENSMTAFNFLRLACRDIFPLIILIIVLLMSADVVSSENDEGTFKFLLIQPISRTKVLMSKIAAVSVNALLTLFASIFIFFIILGIVKGFGSPSYPTEYYSGSMSLFFNKGNGQISLDFISISDFLALVIPLEALVVIFTVSFGVLMSVIIQNSTASICSSILIAIAFNIFNTQLKLLKEVSHIIPFTYCNSVNVVNGIMIAQFNNYGITLFSGLIVLISVSLLFYLVSAIVFRKRDIMC